MRKKYVFMVEMMVDSLSEKEISDKKLVKLANESIKGNIVYNGLVMVEKVKVLRLACDLD